MLLKPKPIKPSIQIINAAIETEILRLIENQRITPSTKLSSLIYSKRDYEIEQLLVALRKTQKAGCAPSQLNTEPNPLPEPHYYPCMERADYLNQFKKVQIEQSADALVEYLENEKNALINSCAKEISENYIVALDRLCVLHLSHATTRLEIAKQKSPYGFFNSLRKNDESSGLKAGQEVCGILVLFDMEPDPDPDCDCDELTFPR